MRCCIASKRCLRLAGGYGLGFWPGWVRETAGWILIAKNDKTHEALAEMFADRRITKTYVALVQGKLPEDGATIQAPISRDSVRRTRMTTRRLEGARHAVSHYRVGGR